MNETINKEKQKVIEVLELINNKPNTIKIYEQTDNENKKIITEYKGKDISKINSVEELKNMYKELNKVLENERKLEENAKYKDLINPQYN